MSEEKRKLKGIKYEENYLGDSSKLYGEKYLKNKDGFEIDPITNKPIASSFAETHNERIFDALKDASNEKPDDPEEIKREYEKLEQSDKNIEDVSNMGLMNNTEIVENDTQKHAYDDFSEQEKKYLERVEQEKKEYECDLNDLNQKIKDQEDKLNEVTEQFNKCEDKDKKIELFQKVNDEMNKLLDITYNYGRVVQNTDTNSVIESLSSYDYGYDEDLTRKYIKDL